MSLGNCKLKQALIKDKRYPNLCLLPTAQTKDKDDIRSQDMFELVNKFVLFKGTFRHSTPKHSLYISSLNVIFIINQFLNNRHTVYTHCSEAAS